MRKLRIAVCSLLVTLSVATYAARVDTLSVYSGTMQKDITVVVIAPDRCFSGTACPTLYLLHGFGGNAFTWIQMRPDLPEVADRLGMLFVCPDGNNSWYIDSPVDATVRYETFCTSELIYYIDHHYMTWARREGRAVTGLSMGGHGALWLSIRHQDLFAGGGSMSGGLDIRPFEGKWDLVKLLGKRTDYPSHWDEFTVINQLGKLTNGSLALTIDCGVDDFFFPVNRAVHDVLVAHQIDHDFTARNGAHTQDYWRNALDFQLVFFDHLFHRNQ